MFLSENYNSRFRTAFRSVLEHGFQNALRRTQKHVEAHETPWEYRDSPPVKNAQNTPLKRILDDVSFRELF